MSAPPRVADIVSYLADREWEREAGAWRGASVWSLDGRSVLVPGRDGMADGDLRVREIIDELAKAEQRPRAEIATDITSPLTDVQTYRTFPRDLPSGMTTLNGGVNAHRGIREVLEAAARVLYDGLHSVLPVTRSDEAERLLNTVRLGPALAGSYLLTARIPTDQQRGRELGHQLFDAISAVSEAVNSEDESAFDETVTAGVSAELCTGLSLLSADEEPLEIGFRWARARPTDLPTTTIRLPAGASPRFRTAASRLRQLSVRHAATMTGLIESLHDGGEGSGDRWRIKVRGRLEPSAGSRNRPTIWVRLTGQPTYNQALEAHRDGHQIRAQGALSNTDRRLELHTEPDGFHVLG